MKGVAKGSAVVKEKNEKNEKKYGEWLTAPEVAEIVSSDFKTVHNWVNKGKLKAFRTPGRHLRITRKSLLAFLKEYGYPIPKWLSKSK